MDELTNELGVEWAMSNDTNGIKPKYAEKPTPVPRHSPKSYTHWPGTEPGSLQWQDALYRPSHGTAFSYRGADKSLARPGRKQANVSIRMAWISFGALPCRKKKTWQLTSRCCWNHARPWHASELASFLVGLRTYQHPGTSKGVGPTWHSELVRTWHSIFSEPVFIHHLP